MSEVVPERPKILVVEDEQIVAMDLRRTLQQFGYEVAGIAGRGTDAVNLAGSVSPDLVLMDIHLQGQMDGIEAADEIRRRWQIPVVFVTANATDSTLCRARTVAPFGYLTKPFRANELNATVAVALTQHRLAQELFSEHTWLTTMLAGLSDGVIATDAEGLVRYINPVAESLTGWSAAEGVGKPIEEIYSLLTLNGGVVHKSKLRRVLATGRALGRSQYLLADRSGRQIAIEEAASPIQGASGSLGGAVVVFLDISERRRAEREGERLVQELERSNEDLAKFSYAVSHDLQAPVRTIRSMAQLLERRSEGQLRDEEKGLLTLIEQAADGMQRLIGSLLEYAQLGKGDIVRETVPAASIIESVEATLAPMITEKQATVRYGALPVIEADRVQIEQLFQNLITNAIQYRRPEEALVIQISGEATHGGWQFAVKDNGQGIPPSSQESIFEPLKRLHGREVPGTGLGLALCRTIVERHGGRIWVESEGTGSGASFCFTLRGRA